MPAACSPVSLQLLFLSIRIRIAAEIRLPSTQSGGGSSPSSPVASTKLHRVRFLASSESVVDSLLRWRKSPSLLNARTTCRYSFAANAVSSAPPLTGVAGAAIQHPAPALLLHLQTSRRVHACFHSLVFLSVLSIKPPPHDRSLSLKHGSCSGQSKSALQASREKSGPCPGRLYAAKNAGV